MWQNKLEDAIIRLDNYLASVTEHNNQSYQRIKVTSKSAIVVRVTNHDGMCKIDVSVGMFVDPERNEMRVEHITRTIHHGTYNSIQTAMGRRIWSAYRTLDSEALDICVADNPLIFDFESDDS